MSPPRSSSPPTRCWSPTCNACAPPPVSCRRSCATPPTRCGCGPALRSCSSARTAPLRSRRRARRGDQRVHVLGRSPVGDAMFRDALGVGAETVAGLPASETWLVELLTDVGDGAAAPGVTIGVIGGSGGAGATVFAAALAQMATGVGRTLLVDADPIGAGIDRVLGPRGRRRHPVGLDAADDRPAELALAARGAATHGRALGADLAGRPAGAAAGVRDARGALGRAARVRRRGGRPAAPPRRRGRGDDQPLRPRRAGLDADRAGRGAPRRAWPSGCRRSTPPRHLVTRGSRGGVAARVGEPAAPDPAAGRDGRPARPGRGDRPRCRSGAVPSRHAGSRCPLGGDCRCSSGRAAA